MKPLRPFCLTLMTFMALLLAPQHLLAGDLLKESRLMSSQELEELAATLLEAWRLARVEGDHLAATQAQLSVLSPHLEGSRPTLASLVARHGEPGILEELPDRLTSCYGNTAAPQIAWYGPLGLLLSPQKKVLRVVVRTRLTTEAEESPNAISALEDEDAELVSRVLAIWTRSRAGNDADRERFQALLAHPHRIIRAAAATALGELRNPAATDSLQSTWDGDSDGFVRAALAESLGRHGAVKALPRLLLVFEDVDESLQGFASPYRSSASLHRVGEAIGRIGGPEAERFLIKTLETSKSVHAVSASTLGLWQLGSEALEPLVRLYGKAPDKHKKWRVLEALRGLPSPEGKEFVQRIATGPDKKMAKKAKKLLEKRAMGQPTPKGFAYDQDNLRSTTRRQQEALLEANLPATVWPSWPLSAYLHRSHLSPGVLHIVMSEDPAKPCVAYEEYAIVEWH